VRATITSQVIDPRTIRADDGPMQNEHINHESAQRLIDAYLACWNASDDEVRSRMIGETWHDDARSVDPLADVSGHAAIAEMMAGIQTQMPGHQFEQRGTARDHHDVVHWEWAMCGPDGIEVLTGIDTASVRDGRIVSLYGFFDA
jgi:hypothetical protein